MKVIQTNSFVNCILKSIRFYMPSSKIFSTVAESDAQKRNSQHRTADNAARLYVFVIILVRF